MICVIPEVNIQNAIDSDLSNAQFISYNIANYNQNTNNLRQIIFWKYLNA